MTRGSSGSITIVSATASRSHSRMNGCASSAARYSPAAPDGEILEMRPATAPLLAALAARASEAPLTALFIDYGHAKSGIGDTLQAVRRHRYADPLALPGETDVTAHVDFAALKHDAEALGLRAYGAMPQGEFLLRLGLSERRDRLLEAARPEQRELISSGAARLVDPSQMGILFKVLALGRGVAAPLLGFSRGDRVHTL